MMNTKDLIALARDMARRGRPGGSRAGRPKTVYLNRAISTAYQALFLTLCKNVADLFIGPKRSLSDDSGWELAYRAVEHGKARNICENKKIMSQFSIGIRDLGAIFSEGQELRHRSDYKPDMRIKLEDVLNFIDRVENGIEGFNAVKKSERKSFLARIVFNKRNS